MSAEGATKGAELERCTMADYARRIGKSRQYVLKLKEQSRLVLDADGLVIVARTDALIAATRDPSRGGDRTKPAASTAASGGDAAPAAPAPADGLPTELAQVRTYQEAKMLAELERLREMRRERAIAEGLLVERAVVEREAERLARATFERAIAMVDRVAPLLAAAGDVAEVAALLEAEVRSVFADVAQLAQSGVARDRAPCPQPEAA
jgi:hypothetical protein